MDHGDHNPPWWTRSVQDHLGPYSAIFLMLPQAYKEVRGQVGRIVVVGGVGASVSQSLSGMSMPLVRRAQ